MAFTAGSKLKASDLVALDQRGTYTRYTGTTTPIVHSAWTAIPFATLAQGTGLGLSVSGDNKTFTMTKAGVWEVKFMALANTSANQTGCVFALAATTAFSTYFAQQGTPLLAGASQASVTYEMNSDGTGTIVCGVFLVVSTGTTDSALLTSPMAPRLTFKWISE
jgi:hypothetical protein